MAKSAVWQIPADVVPVDREKFEYLKEVEIRLGMILDYIAEEDRKSVEEFGREQVYFSANPIKRMAGYYPDAQVVEAMRVKKCEKCGGSEDGSIESI